MRSRTLYFRNLLCDMKDHWLVILIVVLAFTAAFGFYGYKKATDNQALSAEQQEKIDHFNERVASYDEAIADTEKCITENTEAIENLQNYIDNSIYMKLDPDNLKISSVQYVITVDEGVNMGNVQNSIISFINDGGLISSLQVVNSDSDAVSYGEYEVLNPAYWRDVVSIYCPANMAVISVTHYDADIGMQILNVIREKLATQCEVIRVKQGNFQLTGEEISTLTKGDVNIANNQNGNHNNLRSYLSLRSDYETKFVNQNTAKENYIENNTPEEVTFSNPKKNAVKFGIFGIIVGALLPFGVLAIRYILSGRIRSQEELQGTGLAMLASVRKEQLNPSAGRLSIELELLREAAGCNGVFIQDISAGEKRRIMKKSAFPTAINPLLDPVFEKSPDQFAVGVSEGDDLAEFNKMRELGAAILLVACGKTTFAQVEKQLNLCERSGIQLLGYVLYE